MLYKQRALETNKLNRKSRIIKVVRIFVFEASASILLVYGIMSSQFETTPIPTPDGYIPATNPAHSGFSSLCTFLIMSFSGQLTSGHSNPSIGLTLAVSPNNKISPRIFLAYMAADYAGALLGAALTYALIPHFTCPGVDSEFNEMKVFGAQFLGTFIICLFSLIIIHEKTTFVQSIFWSYVLLAVVYYAAREVTQQIDGLNPSLVLAQQIFYGVKKGDWSPIGTYWVYLVSSIVGSLAAALFYNNFYFPLCVNWKQINLQFDQKSESVQQVRQYAGMKVDLSDKKS